MRFWDLDPKEAIVAAEVVMERIPLSQMLWSVTA